MRNSRTHPWDLSPPPHGIWSNSPNNLYLDSPVTVSTSGVLESGLHIGISVSRWPSSSRPRVTVMSGITSCAGGFVSDKSPYVAAITESGTLQIMNIPTYYDLRLDLSFPAALTAIEANAFEGLQNIKKGSGM